MEIKTKSEFYRRFWAGEFGNRGPMWKDLRAFTLSGYRGLIAIRVKKPGGRCDYDIPPHEVAARVKSFLADGYQSCELNFAAMAPTSKTLIQGEVCRRPEGLSLFYSKAKLPMRNALAESPETADGLRALIILGYYLDADSLLNIHRLLNQYSEAVVEFSTFSCNWGVIPNRNTVIWEVRNY